MSFQNIYLSAKNKSYTDLKKSLLDTCIDCWENGYPFLSPAAKLLIENDYQSALFLLQHGANINFILFAAAYIGDFDLASKLVAYGGHINYYAYGAAMGKHNAKALELKKSNADIHDIFQGAARGNNKELINLLENNERYANDLAVGAILAHDIEHAREQMNRGANIGLIIRTAAQCGLELFASEFIEENDFHVQYIFGLSLANKGLDYIKFCKETNVKLICPARAAATSGNLTLVVELVEIIKQQSPEDLNDSINQIIWAASFSGHYQILNRMLQNKEQAYTALHGFILGNHFLTSRNLLITGLSKVVINAIRGSGITEMEVENTNHKINYDFKLIIKARSFARRYSLTNMHANLIFNACPILRAIIIPDIYKGTNTALLTYSKNKIGSKYIWIIIIKYLWRGILNEDHLSQVSHDIMKIYLIKDLIKLKAVISTYNFSDLIRQASSLSDKTNLRQFINANITIFRKRELPNDKKDVMFYEQWLTLLK